MNNNKFSYKFQYFMLKIIFILCLFLAYSVTVQGVTVQADSVCSKFVKRGVKRVQSDSTQNQHALVVGIDKYRYIAHKNLNGTVNDAKVIESALRNAGIPTQMLLDEQATRSAVVQAWCNMVMNANVGDTLIFTYAGHGGQQRDTAPIDEDDGQDETLMLHDFDPVQPTLGVIKDDELFALFAEAKDYKILFISDSCHSRGMVRSLASPSGLGVRTVGKVWDISPDAPKPFPSLPMRGDEKKFLPHVTLITAVDQEHLVVSEVMIGGKVHGALSWSFAEALSGKADGNNNGQLERDELEVFLKEKVRFIMKNSQTPNLLSRGDSTSIVTLKAKFTRPSLLDNVKISVKNAPVPKILKHIQIVTSAESDLRFVVKGENTEVFNNAGDKIALLPSREFNLWQRVVDKERLLQTLSSRFDMRLSPVIFTLREGDGLHKKGEQLHFSVAPKNTAQGLNALTLFNLSSDGELQFLYPLKQYGDLSIIKKFPFELPPMKITPPFGGDSVVAILCTKPTPNLHKLLMDNEPNPPQPKEILNILKNQKCQVGQYAFFSSVD